MCEHTRNDSIKNENIRSKVEVTAIEDKMRENQFKWFGYVNQRLTVAPIRDAIMKRNLKEKGVEEDLGRL